MIDAVANPGTETPDAMAERLMERREYEKAMKVDAIAMALRERDRQWSSSLDASPDPSIETRLMHYRAAALQALIPIADAKAPDDASDDAIVAGIAERTEQIARAMLAAEGGGR